MLPRSQSTHSPGLARQSTAPSRAAPPRVGRVFLCLAAGAVLSGCSAGLTRDGQTVVGWKVGDEATVLQQAGDAISGVAGTVGPMLPPPWGQTVMGLGAVGTAVAGAGWMKSKGRHEGWDEKAEADAKAKAGIPA